MTLHKEGDGLPEHLRQLSREICEGDPKTAAMLTLAARRLNEAREIADVAAVSMIESHGRRTDMEGRWYDIAGEPCEPEASYLESRGMLKREPFAPTLVCITSEAI